MRGEYLAIFYCAVLILTQMKYDNFTGLTCVLNFAPKMQIRQGQSSFI